MPTTQTPAAAPSPSFDAPFEFPVRVYWEDTDAGGIVFYANYLKFFERARTEWLRSLGVQQQALREQTGGMFVVSETQVKYHRPARLDDRLCVTAQLEEIGRVSLTIKQSSLLISEQTTPPCTELGAQPNQGVAHGLLCEGSIRIGWVDAATLRPARIPAHVTELLRSTRLR